MAMPRGACCTVSSVITIAMLGGGQTLRVHLDNHFGQGTDIEPSLLDRQSPSTRQERASSVSPWTRLARLLLLVPPAADAFNAATGIMRSRPPALHVRLWDKHREALSMSSDPQSSAAMNRRKALEALGIATIAATSAVPAAAHAVSAPELGQALPSEDLSQYVNSSRAFGESENKLVQSAIKFITGGIAGSIGAAAVYPVDSVKTRLQNERTPQGQEPKYTGALDCFTKTVREEGASALYQGLLPQVVGVWPEKAIKLTVNDAVRKVFADPATGSVALPFEILAGAAGGLFQDIFTNPLEIVKVRLQVADSRSGKQLSPIEVTKELGFAGLYQGVGVCLARDVPFSAIYFPAFAHLKEAWIPAGEEPLLRLLLAGAIAAIPAAYLVTPADVIKTRLQVKAEDGQDVYKGPFDCYQQIVEKEGWQALFKGGVQRVARSSPQFAVTLTVFDILNDWVAKNLQLS